MPSPTTRRIALVAGLIGIAVLGRVWLDDAADDTTRRNRALDARYAAAREAPARGGPASAPAVAADAAASTSAIRPAPNRTDASRAAREAVRLEVHAPSHVRVGEVFQARVDIAANVPLRTLMFSIVYESALVRLVGRREGEFARQPGVASEFGVDEPSDGNAEVVFRAVDGSAATGSGSIAVLEFEAVRPGATGIALRNVRSIDARGEVAPRVSVTQERVTIR